jgi:hypothetical protein
LIDNQRVLLAQGLLPPTPESNAQTSREGHL